MTQTAYARPSPNVSVFVRVEHPKKQDCCQLDMFAGQFVVWVERMMTLALSFNRPFYGSELRDKAPNEPPSSSDWGKLFAGLKRHGFVQTGRYRKHTRESRKGGVDFEYVRRVAV